MKNYILTLLFLSSIFISCSASKKLNGFGEKDKVCQKYDPTSDITSVHDYNGPEIKIKGKWRESKKTIFSEYYISHCPIVEDENKITLELWARNYEDNDWHKAIAKNKQLSNNELLIIVKNGLESLWTNANIKYKILKSDTKSSFYAYELTENNKKRVELIGIKNNKYYRFSIFNYDLATHEPMGDFLIGIFNTN